MDFVERLSGRTSPFGQQFRMDTLLKFTDLAPQVQKHLEKVYVTLAGALLVCAVGVAFNIFTGLGGWLSLIGFVVSTAWLSSLPSVPQTLNKRYALLASAAFAQGCSVGPLVSIALNVHPSVVLTAVLGTTAVFACFSAAAALSRRRSYLFLGGALSSAVSVLMLMRLASWVFGARQLVFQAELYGGLLVFIGYVMFDTQVIIEKAYAAHNDHVKDALGLFVDFMAIFVRLLVILLQNQEKRRQDEGKRRRRT